MQRSRATVRLIKTTESNNCKVEYEFQVQKHLRVNAKTGKVMGVAHVTKGEENCKIRLKDINGKYVSLGIIKGKYALPLSNFIVQTFLRGDHEDNITLEELKRRCNACLETKIKSRALFQYLREHTTLQRKIIQNQEKMNKTIRQGVNYITRVVQGASPQTKKRKIIEPLQSQAKQFTE